MAQRENHAQLHKCQRLIIHLMVEGYSELKVKSGKIAKIGQDVVRLSEEYAQNTIYLTINCLINKTDFSQTKKM